MSSRSYQFPGFPPYVRRFAARHGLSQDAADSACRHSKQLSTFASLVSQACYKEDIASRAAILDRAEEILYQLVTAAGGAIEIIAEARRELGAPPVRRPFRILEGYDTPVSAPTNGSGTERLDRPTSVHSFTSPPVSASKTKGSGS